MTRCAAPARARRPRARCARCCCRAARCCCRVLVVAGCSRSRACRAAHFVPVVRSALPRCRCCARFAAGCGAGDRDRALPPAHVVAFPVAARCCRFAAVPTLMSSTCPVRTSSAAHRSLMHTLFLHLPLPAGCLLRAFYHVCSPPPPAVLRRCRVRPALLHLPRHGWVAGLPFVLLLPLHTVPPAGCTHVLPPFTVAAAVRARCARSPAARAVLRALFVISVRDAHRVSVFIAMSSFFLMPPVFATTTTTMVSHVADRSFIVLPLPLHFAFAFAHILRYVRCYRTFTVDTFTFALRLPTTTARGVHTLPTILLLICLRYHFAFTLPAAHVALDTF